MPLDRRHNERSVLILDRVDRANQTILERLEAQQKRFKDSGIQLERVEQLLFSRSKQASTSAMEEAIKRILQYNENSTQVPPTESESGGGVRLRQVARLIRLSLSPVGRVSNEF